MATDKLRLTVTMQYNIDDQKFISFIKVDTEVSVSVMTGELDGEIGLLPQSTIGMLNLLALAESNCSFEIQASHGSLLVRTFCDQMIVSAMAEETNSLVSVYLDGEALLGFKTFLAKLLHEYWMV